MVQAVEVVGIADLVADLDIAGNGLTPDIAVRAMNKGINKCKSFAVKTTATAKKLTQKTVRDKWRIRGAKRNPVNLSADMILFSRPVPWIQINTFNGTRTTGGVSAGASRKELRGFVATMPNGYTSAFVRRETGKPKGRANPYRGSRIGKLKPRLQIDEITQTLEPEGESSTKASIPFGEFVYRKEAERLLDLRLSRLNR